MIRLSIRPLIDVPNTMRAEGSIRATLVLLTPEEVDAAARRSVEYRPPSA